MAKDDPQAKPGLKSYVVREGFNFQTPVPTASGGTVFKEYEAGEVVNLPAFPADSLPHQLEEVA